MSTDVSAKKQKLQAASGGRKNAGLRSRGRFVFAIVAIGAVALCAVLIRGAMSREKSGNVLTHTVARGDLVISVTEQGTLESSNNTEIKCKVRGYNTVIWVIDGGAEVEAGDVLVRLDTKRIEDANSLQTTNAHTARATYERSLAEVAKAKIAIPAYLEGSYKSQLKGLERQLKIAKENLATAQKMLDHNKMMFKRGYVTELEVEGNAFTVEQAKLELNVVETEIEVLNKYTKEMELVTLKGNLAAAESKLEADRAGLSLDEGRLARTRQEFADCVIEAERSGLVIYPSAAEWKDTPDITKGATVRKDQVLLLMPDLSKMQVKVGVHESVVDRIKPGFSAKVTLPDTTIAGEISSVASVTKPAGWWTGNVVKYDTIIELPTTEGLKPGMSAEIEIILNRYKDVLTIPVAAVLEMAEGDFCWAQSSQGIKRRTIKLGDTDDSFVIVESGLKEGEEVVLNPLALIEEAQVEVLKPLEETKPARAVPFEGGDDSKEGESTEANDAK